MSVFYHTWNASKVINFEERVVEVVTVQSLSDSVTIAFVIESEYVVFKFKNSL